MNSYLVIVRRGEKFYSHESVYCFYTYWTDIFSFFWIDLFVIIKKKTRGKKGKKRSKNKKPRIQKDNKSDDIEINMPPKDELKSQISDKSKEKKKTVKVVKKE